MNPAAKHPGEWSRSRWLMTVLGVLGLQVGLIFALGERTPPRTRVVGAVQTLQLTTGRADLQELLDPTLFARPHARDFSAASWLRVLPPAFPVYRWTEATRPLELPAEQLGLALGSFLRTNRFAAYSVEGRPEPEMWGAEPAVVAEAVPGRSQLLVVGALAGRALLNAPDLPPQPAADLLTNTLVQVLVDARGSVLTAVQLGVERLGGGSGSTAADSLALSLATSLRFAPISDGDWLVSPATQLTRGVLVFQWRTERSTNGAAEPFSNP